MKQKTFYDIYNYPDGFEKRKEFWKKQLNWHTDLSKLKDKKVLDVGCGTGTFSKILHDYGADVHAIDLSKESINRVNKNYPEIKAEVGDALELKFPDNCFDAVMSIGVLHHTNNSYKGLQECIRVCKPKGRVIIILYTKWHYYPLMYNGFKLLKNGRKPEDMPKWIIKAVKGFAEWYYKEKRTEDDAVRLIADQFFTPIARFHSEFEVRKWAEDNGCSLASTSTTYFGQHKIYNIVKEEKERKYDVASGEGFYAKVDEGKLAIAGIALIASIFFGAMNVIANGFLVMAVQAGGFISYITGLA